MNSEVKEEEQKKKKGESSSSSRREDFSLLSDIVPEDRELRRKLQMDRLEQVSEYIVYSTRGQGAEAEAADGQSGTGQ
jgi:hypothetical protein